METVSESRAKAQSQIHYKLIEGLSQSEKRFRTLVNNIPDLVFTLGRDGKIVFANSAWKELLGYSSDQVVGSYLWDYLESEDLKLQIQASFKACHERGSLSALAVAASPSRITFCDVGF